MGTAKALKVAAPLVTARTNNGRVVYLFHGDKVGKDITQESIDHLASLGFVVEDDEVVDDQPAAQKPAGNASAEAWAEYAKQQGKSDEDLDGKSRDEIRALFA